MMHSSLELPLMVGAEPAARASLPAVGQSQNHPNSFSILISDLRRAGPSFSATCASCCATSVLDRARRHLAAVGVRNSACDRRSRRRRHGAPSSPRRVELVEQANQARALDPQRLGEVGLRQPRIGADQHQHGILGRPHAARP